MKIHGVFTVDCLMRVESNPDVVEVHGATDFGQGGEQDGVSFTAAKVNGKDPVAVGQQLKVTITDEV